MIQFHCVRVKKGVKLRRKIQIIHAMLRTHTYKHQLGIKTCCYIYRYFVWFELSIGSVFQSLNEMETYAYGVISIISVDLKSVWGK